MNANIRTCQKCGAVAIVYGNRLPAGTPKGTPKTDCWQRFIATKYCPTCAEEARRENGAWRSRKYRRSRKKERATYNKAIRICNERINIQQRAIEALETRLEQLHAENFALQVETKAAYQRGQQDARHSLTGRVLDRLAGRQ